MSEFVLLKTKEGDSAKIYLHGATVTSWMCKDTEMLFVSENAVFDNKKAIRGGIPVVFPNFGPWEAGPQHGFARISKWSLCREPQVDNECACATFVLEDSESTRKMWNYRFKLTYTVTVGKNKLSTSLDVQNKDDKPFDFTTLLHTYFQVPDITKATVTGFQALKYIDKVKKGEIFTESNEPITINCETDRVYMNTPKEHTLTQGAGGHTLVLQKVNLPDTVVWNPWVDKAKAMSDFGDGEYPFMLCVEAGYVDKPYTLQPGSTFECSQTFACVCA